MRLCWHDNISMLIGLQSALKDRISSLCTIQEMTFLSGRQLISCRKKQLTIPSAREESFSGIWWNVFIKFPINSTLSAAAAVWFNHSFFSYSLFVAHAYTNKKNNPRTVCTFIYFFIFL